MSKDINVKISSAVTLSRCGILFAPSDFKMSNPTYLFPICNGCGAANSKFDFVPDRIFGTDISAACVIHDYMYYQGVTVEDKDEADRVFLNNLLRIIDREKKWYKPKMWMRIRARNYYRAVKYFGGPAFWAGKP